MGDRRRNPWPPTTVSHEYDVILRRSSRPDICVSAAENLVWSVRKLVIFKQCLGARNLVPWRRP